MRRERSLVVFKRSYDRLPNVAKINIDAGALLLELGMQFRQVRQEEFSVSQIAKMAHLSTKTIWKIESGESVNFKSIVKYLTALGYKIELKSNLFS